MRIVAPIAKLFFFCGGEIKKMEGIAKEEKNYHKKCTLKVSTESFHKKCPKKGPQKSVNKKCPQSVGGYPERYGR